MYIAVEHDIRNSKKFFEQANAAMDKIPSNLKLHQFLPSKEGNLALCLWEGPDLKTVKDYVERSVGAYSKNTYYAVQADKAVGLPAAV